jgi:DNA-binding transcriptional MerR regulator
MTVYLVSDVAQALGITDHGVRFLERAGRCPAFARTPGGVRLFDIDTIERVRRERANLKHTEKDKRCR